MEVPSDKANTFTQNAIKKTPYYKHMVFVNNKSISRILYST